jgi:hypothetical protein
VYALSRVIDLHDRVTHFGSTLACSGYVLARLLYAKFIGNGSSILLRRETAIAVGGYESSWAARGIGGCEDLDFELKIAAEHRLLAVPQFLVGYRVYEGNMSSDVSRMARALVATIEHHVRANPALPQWAAAVAVGAAREYACSLLLRDRYWKRALEEFAGLARCDLGRAVDVFATVVARKLRKLGAAKMAEVRVDRPLFSDLDPDSADRFENTASPRDRMNLKNLESLDAALERNVPVEPPVLPGVALTGYRERAF